MKKEDVIEFFDRLAPGWDADMIRSDEVIGEILDNAGVTAGKEVLDVACGTGVLIPDYLEREVAQVTGIDISEEMIKIARRKFAQEQVLFLHEDVEQMDNQKKYDCIVIYNAFPHFPEPERLIGKLAGMLKKGGYLTVAHGMSRERIDACHKGSASKVSMGLMSEEDLAHIFEKYLEVTTVISNHKMYQVVGRA